MQQSYIDVCGITRDNRPFHLGRAFDSRTAISLVQVCRILDVYQVRLEIEIDGQLLDESGTTDWADQFIVGLQDFPIQPDGWEFRNKQNYIRIRTPN